MELKHLLSALTNHNFSHFFLVENMTHAKLTISRGRGLVDRKLVKAPSNFIADRPTAAPLFLVLWWFLMWRVVIYSYSRYI